MASCHDCVHVEVCGTFSILSEDFEIASPERIASDCNCFKDRARFVELPCTGDKVYELCRINQFGDYKIDESEIKGFIVDTDGTAFDYELLGERFFLTREEAEQDLKERESNGQSQN